MVELLRRKKIRSASEIYTNSIHVHTYMRAKWNADSGSNAEGHTLIQEMVLHEAQTVYFIH